MQPNGGLQLTVVQLLWISIIADGPPALALRLDRNLRVIGQLRRDPKAPLLDPASLRFIIVTGVVKVVSGRAVGCKVTGADDPIAVSVLLGLEPFDLSALTWMAGGVLLS